MQVRIRDYSFVDQIRYNVPFSCPTGLNSHNKKKRMAEDSSIDINVVLYRGPMKHCLIMGCPVQGSGGKHCLITRNRQFWCGHNMDDAKQQKNVLVIRQKKLIPPELSPNKGRPTKYWLRLRQRLLGKGLLSTLELALFRRLDFTLDWLTAATQSTRKVHPIFHSGNLQEGTTPCSIHSVSGKFTLISRVWVGWGRLCLRSTIYIVLSRSKHHQGYKLTETLRLQRDKHLVSTR